MRAFSCVEFASNATCQLSSNFEGELRFWTFRGHNLKMSASRLIPISAEIFAELSLDGQERLSRDLLYL